MNGFLIAVLGGVVLIAFVLLWKWKAGQRRGERPAVVPDLQVLPPVQPPVDGPQETEQAVAEPAPPVAEAEPPEVIEAPEVAVQEVTSAPEPVVEETAESAEPEQEMPEAEFTAEDILLTAPELAEDAILSEEAPAAEQPLVEGAPEPESADEELALPEPVAVDEAIASPESEPLEVVAPEAEAAELVEEAQVPVEAVEEPIPEAEAAQQAVPEPLVVPAAPVMEDLIPVEKPSEPALLLVRMSMESYSARLNALEERQRAALAEAIKGNDDRRRDQLQRELVLMNDRLALLADSYVEEMACFQQVLDALAHLRAEMSDASLDQAIEGLQTGNTEAAAAFLADLSRQAHPFAVEAAYLCGQLAECRVDLQLAMDCYRRAVTNAPEVPQYLRAAGLMARNLYQYKEALPWLERYVELAKQEEADATTVALAQRELAYTSVLAGQYQKAGPLYKESMTVLAQKLGQDHQEMAISWQQIGEFQETMGEYDKAVSLYKKALAIMEKKRGPEHPALAHIIGKLAALCVELEMEPEAVPLYERLVRIQEKALRSTHPQLVISLNNLAEAYRLRGRYADAEACYQKTLRINEAVHGAEHPSVAAILQELAKLCTSQRKAEEAQAYQERATAIFQKSVEAAEQKAGSGALTLELS